MGGGNNETLQDQQAHDPEEHEEQAREYEVIYADDADITIDLDATHPMTRKLLNYGALSATRDGKIQWGRVGIIARLKEHGALKNSYRAPLIYRS